MTIETLSTLALMWAICTVLLLCIKAIKTHKINLKALILAMSPVLNMVVFIIICGYFICDIFNYIGKSNGTIIWSKENDK